MAKQSRHLLKKFKNLNEKPVEIYKRGKVFDTGILCLHGQGRCSIHSPKSTCFYEDEVTLVSENKIYI